MLLTTNKDGALKPVRAAWLHDGEQWLGISCAWVAGSLGALVKSEGCITPVDMDLISTTPFAIQFGWSAPGADAVRLLLNGSPWKGEEKLGPVGTLTLDGLNPDTKYTLQIAALYGLEVINGPVLDATTGQMPAPTNARTSDVTTNSYKLSFNPVVGAAKYSLVNADTGAEYDTTTLTTYPRTGLASNTTYRDVVRAVHASGKISPNSNTSTVKTLNRFPAGTYTFYASSADTWSAGAQAWRGTGQGKLWHGDGGAFGASGGSRYAFFFGYKEASTGLSPAQFFASKGALDYTVTKVEVYMKRSSTQHGVYSAQSCSWSVHKHASKPAKAVAEWGHMAGSLKLGEGKWIEIDRSYGRHLATGGYHGIAWGGTPYYSSGAGYMYGPTTLTGGTPMGAISITVS